MTSSLGNIHVYPDAAQRIMAPGEPTPRFFDRMAERVLRRAVAGAPVQTGQLKGSAAVVHERGGWTVVFRAGHALYVEMGHRTRQRRSGIGRGRTNGFVQPQPFLRPALNAEVRESLR